MFTLFSNNTIWKVLMFIDLVLLTEAGAEESQQERKMFERVALYFGLAIACLLLFDLLKNREIHVVESTETAQVNPEIIKELKKEVNSLISLTDDLKINITKADAMNDKHERAAVLLLLMKFTDKINTKISTVQNLINSHSFSDVDITLANAALKSADDQLKILSNSVNIVHELIEALKTNESVITESTNKMFDVTNNQ